MGRRSARPPPADRIPNIVNAEGKAIMTTSTSTSSRNASKRAPRNIDELIEPINATPVLALDDDIAAVVKACVPFAAIEAGHAEQLAQHNARTDAALAEYVRLARARKAQRRPIGGFHRAMGSGNGNTHRRLMLTGALWDAYQTVPETEDPTGAVKRFQEEGADIITFTSASTVECFLDLGLSIPERCLIASIGPVTSEAVEENGYTVDLEAKEHDIPGLVAASIFSVRSRFRRRRRRLRKIPFTESGSLRTPRGGALIGLPLRI